MVMIRSHDGVNFFSQCFIHEFSVQCIVQFILLSFSAVKLSGQAHSQTAASSGKLEYGGAPGETRPTSYEA